MASSPVLQILGDNDLRSCDFAAGTFALGSFPSGEEFLGEEFLARNWRGISGEEFHSLIAHNAFAVALTVLFST